MMSSFVLSCSLFNEVEQVISSTFLNLCCFNGNQQVVFLHLLMVNTKDSPLAGAIFEVVLVLC